MDPLSFDSITTDRILLPGNKDIEAFVLRLDKIHPVISGNKWFKLQYYIKEAQAQGKSSLLTFGGAWSNHIVATAAAAAMNGLGAVGIIRGEEPAVLSPTLLQAKKHGMELHFISRSDYSLKKIPPTLGHDNHYIIAEGGYGELGAKGAASMLALTATKNYTHTCCAVGTGTMMAGLVNASSLQQQVIGISVLKNEGAPEEAVAALLDNKQRPFSIYHDYHFGGYAKYRPELVQFMNEFYRQTRVASDFVYTGKLFFGINDLAAKNWFPPASRLLLVHSGGLQGNDSLSKGTLIF